jgi:integrase
MKKGRNTFGLLFYIKKSWRGTVTHAHLYMRITINGSKSAFALNRKVDAGLWDSKRGKVRSRCSSADEINSYIDMLRSKAYEVYKDLIYQGKVCSPQTIIDIIQGRDKHEHTLLKLMERHNQVMKAGIGITSSYGNYKNFKTSLKYLTEFVSSQYRRTDIFISELDLNFIQEYSLFLQKEKDCHNNGAMKQIQRLKKVVNHAVLNEWISKDPFRSYKIKFKPYDKIILNAAELLALENLQGLNSKLALTRDVFIFCCYTGLAYVDIQQLSKENLVEGIDGNLWIITRRKKTDIKARIPLLPKALQIIEKYKDHKKLKSGHILPIYSNQKTNDYLKELAGLASISKSLTFHCARHVFATSRRPQMINDDDGNTHICRKILQ